MSEDDSDKQIMEILNSIFSSIDGKLLPIIKISEKLSSIIEYLSQESNPLDKKVKLLSILNLIFQENKSLIHYFITKCKTENLNLLECIINTYLIEALENDNKTVVENLLNLIVENSTITKSLFEFIYQKLSLFFIDDKTNKINENYLLKTFKLLQIFYQDISVPNESSESTKEKITNDSNDISKYVVINQDKKIVKKDETKEVNNYIYLNGKGSFLSLTLNKNSINVNSNFPTLEYGTSFLFWVYLDKDLTNYFFEVNKNLKINLITINIGKHQIKLLFNSIKSLKFIVDELVSNDIDITNKFAYNTWNNICFLIEKKGKNYMAKIIINGFDTSFTFPLTKNFPINEPMNKVKLFENFFGKISTVLFFSFNISMNMITYFKNNFKHGFPKNKYLFKFLNSNDEEYFSNTPDYNFYQKYKNSTKANNANSKLFKIKLKEHNIKYLISCFVPFTYDQDKNTIDDIFGNFIGYLGYDDVVNNFTNYSNALNFVGGINNLLPFAELMYNNKDILNENTFYEYLYIMDEIFIGHTKNLIEANKNKFFSNLGLFLEKYPPNVYSNKILEIFLKIGKETFQLSDDKFSSYNNFVNMILLNEKIFSKFSPDNQSKLWEGVYQFFVSDYSQLRESLNISKICLLLRFYDGKKYEEYCCKRHCDYFHIKDENNKENNNISELKVMNPEMNFKIDKLFDIIQLYIKQFYKEREIVNLYKLLSLDLSPCLQIKIIQVYINHFSNKNISSKDRIITLENLLRNNFLEISEYVLSISLLDVRIEVLKLIKLLLQNYSTTIKSYISNNNTNSTINNTITNNDNTKNNNIPTLANIITSSGPNNACTSILTIYMFIGENLLPDKLMVEIDNNNNNKIVKVTYPIINFFNKISYEQDKCCLWTLLDSWFATKETSSAGGKKAKSNIRLNGHVLDFCIRFVSSDDTAIFIDSFIKSLINYINDKSILNRDVIYENKNIFPWLIETLFFFFNKDNTEGIDSKKLIESIQKNSIKLYNEYFSNKKIKEDFVSKINYVFEYSYYMKKLFKNDAKKLEELSRITRLLFEKLMEYSSGDELNKKSQVYFDFMFLHKNNEDNLSMIYNDGYDTSLNAYTGKKLKKAKKISFDSDDEDYDLDDGDSNKINLLSEFEKFLKNLKKNSDLIPDYIYDGIYFNIDLINDSKNPKNRKPNNLKDIWKDFSLYDNIIDSYRSNIWGIENVCKKVRIEYDGNPLPLCQKLIKSYTESKKYKNILTADIINCLGIKNLNITNTILNPTNTMGVQSSNKNVLSSLKEDPNKPKINVLKINLILLCIAIDITRETDEKEFLEGIFQQFLIYCVLASININSAEKNNAKIQSELYDILLFGWTFFQKRNKNKFDKLFDSLIKPIFDEINNVHTKKGIKGLFSKKNLFKNTAVIKLFVPEDTYKNKEKEEPEDFDEIDQEDALNSTMMVGYGYATDRRGVFKRGIANNDIMMYKDDTSLNKKKKNIKYILRIEETKLISGKIFDSIINDYLKKRKKGTNNSIIKIFYRNIHPYNIDQEYNEEKIRINNVIKDLIPFFEGYIKKYSNTYYFQEKKRRNEYKKCKKELFSWRGFWSNRYLFFEHPEYLKLKKKNHFTKEMIQPLLSPILDIEYYLPDFKKFDKSKLFNKNNYNYRINLDIDNILKDEIKEIEEKKSNIYKRNSFGFNYLECIYKLPYTGLWEQYKYYHENDFNFERITQKKENNNNYPLLSESSTINSNKEANLTNNQEKEKDKEKEKDIKIDKKNLPIENNYRCCIVKLTHHIKGFLNTEEKYIKFTHNNDKHLEEFDDPNYDKDMGSCFGSIFKNHKKDKDKIDFKIEYLDIRFMFLRHYFYNESAIEIYTESNKSYFLNFKNSKDLSQFIYDVLHHSSFREIKTEDYKGRKSLGYESIALTAKKKSFSIYHKMEDWQNYTISTLEYIMWLNIYAGRSFNDLTQYPVFPWILTNYKTDSLNLKNDLRNLSIPMGMMELSEKSILRKETFIDTYDSLKNDLNEAFPDFNYQEFLKKGDEYYDNYVIKKTKREKTLSMANPEEYMTSTDTNINIVQINQMPYYFGSHYSNPTYISNYLTRTFPFSLTAIEIQGEKFDDPDRIFLSMQKTFESASSLKDDIRELIPEFYTLPEIFLNINNLNLSQDKVDSEGKQIIINDVGLPPWSGNKTTNFVVEMRKNLENSELKINKWIDLIFGNLQRGVGAEENHNIFQAHTYERMVKIDSIEDPDSRNALMRLVEVGVTPFQLFDSESKQKNDKNSISKNKDNFLEESKSIHSLTIKSAKYTLINNNTFLNPKNSSNKEIKQIILPKISKIVNVSPNNLRLYTNTNNWYNLKYNIGNDIKIEEESNIVEIENNSNKFAASYFMNSIQTPIIIYSNNKYMIKGGFWDGRIEINCLIYGPKEEPYNTCIFPNCGAITVMALSKNEQTLICGTKLGVVLVFQVFEKILQIKQKLFLHTNEITSISINDTLNMFATASKDGYIMLNTLPNLELVRSIKVNYKKYTKNINNIYANHVFLSSSPIPVVVIYSSEAKFFKSYSINGLDINEQEEEDYTENIKCFCIYNNIEFQEFLIYGTDDGLVKIRKFPNMNIINSINPFDGVAIETLALSQDKKYCYVWGRDNQIGVIKENNLVSDGQKGDNFGRVGYIKK